jgi:hypothetical protein
MAARTRAKTRRKPLQREPDIREIFGLVVQATVRIKELLAEGQALQAQGKAKEAAALLAEAETIHDRLAALQAEIRLPSKDPPLDSSKP